MNNIPNYTFSAFRKTIGSTVGFRECAQLIHIAQETETKITLSIGNKLGTSDSIISLMSLGLMPGMSIVFTIDGENQVDAYHRLNDLIDNGWQRDEITIMHSTKNKNHVANKDNNANDSNHLVHE